MNNTQNVMFVGRLGINPELKYTKQLKPVCHLSVAVNETKDGPVVWKKVQVWGEQAESCSLRLKKGSEVFISGECVEISYLDSGGHKRVYLEIKAIKVGLPIGK